MGSYAQGLVMESLFFKRQNLAEEKAETRLIIDEINHEIRKFMNINNELEQASKQMDLENALAATQEMISNNVTIFNLYRARDDYNKILITLELMNEH